MIFVPPSFFQGRMLRPCFNGVDAPARPFWYRNCLVPNASGTERDLTHKFHHRQCLWPSWFVAVIVEPLVGRLVM